MNLFWVFLYSIEFMRTRERKKKAYPYEKMSFEMIKDPVKKKVFKEEKKCRCYWKDRIVTKVEWMNEYY